VSVPLFVELCAGTAALSVRLQGGKYARRPVSRLGAKTGYADCILRIMGLRPGQGAAHYLWCEPDAGVRLLLEAYRNHELALAAADIIRGWADEEPRALWERLRAEGPVKSPPVDPREVARWCHLTCQAYDTAKAGREGWTAGGCFLYAHKDTGQLRYPPAGTAARLSALPTLPATIHPDALQVDPREVARSLVVDAWSFRVGNPDSGYNKSEAEGHPNSCKYPRSCSIISEETTSLPTIPATIHPDALQVDPQQLPPSCVVYIDPPYQNTTGYANDLPRAQVLALAMKWAQAGAAVYISEAVPLELPGWHHIDIAGERKGQKRTFSKQQREVITCNVPPAWVPAVQGVLF